MWWRSMDIPKKNRKKNNKKIFNFLIFCGMKKRFKGRQVTPNDDLRMQTLKYKSLKKNFIQSNKSCDKFEVNYVSFQEIKIEGVLKNIVDCFLDNGRQFDFRKVIINLIMEGGFN
jgi:hypothetical protein